MAYIGASLAQVRSAMNKKLLKVQIVPSNDKYGSHDVSIIGLGATDLTIPIGEELVAKWWAGLPGTSVVVGWVHSDVLKWIDEERNRLEIDDTPHDWSKELVYNASKNWFLRVTIPAQFIRFVRVARPARRTLDENEETVQDAFENTLAEAVRKVDNRLRYIAPGYEDRGFWTPTFNTENGTRAGTSRFAVWLSAPSQNRGSNANACRQKCTTAQVCNPVSARCVNRNGVVGKRVLAAQSGAPAPAPAPVAKKTKPAQNTTVRTRVNAGKRVAQAVPKSARSRKAPAGHAKDYKNQVHVGIDGEQWVSSKISTGAYRWKPYKA